MTTYDASFRAGAADYAGPSTSGGGSSSSGGSSSGGGSGGGGGSSSSTSSNGVPTGGRIVGGRIYNAQGQYVGMANTSSSSGGGTSNAGGGTSAVSSAAQNAWNSMNATQQANYWNALSDANRNILTGAGISYSDSPVNSPTSNIPTVTSYSAPNGKRYVIQQSGTGGVSFMGNDGTMQNFDSLSAAQAYIAQNNAAGTTPTTSTAQNQYFSNLLAIGENVEGQELELNELGDELLDSTGKLPTNNAELKKLIADATKAQALKNEQLQASLADYKAKLDTAFESVQNKFTENQQAALDRINQMESSWMNNYNNIRALNDDYYTSQNNALNERVGGESSALASSLAAKGVNEGVVGNAIAQARDSYLSQYTALKETNVNTLKALNQEYLNFFSDVNTMRNKWSDDELALLKDKFAYAKEVLSAGKDIDKDTITNAFKPYEDATNAASASVATAAGYQASDEYKQERYKQSDVASRKTMLIGLLGLDEATLAYGTASNFDIALLNKAVTAATLPEAIQILSKAAAAAASSGSSYASSSQVLGAINNGGSNNGGNTGANNSSSNAGANTSDPTSSQSSQSKGVAADKDGGYFVIRGGKVYKQYYGGGVLFPKTLEEAKKSGLSIYNYDLKDINIPNYVSVSGAVTGAGSTAPVSQAGTNVDYIAQNLTPALAQKYNAMLPTDKEVIKQLFKNDPQRAIEALKNFNP